MRIALGSTGPADEPLREHTVAEDLDGGKFENLNRLLERPRGRRAADWTHRHRRRRAACRAPSSTASSACARRSSSTWRSPRRRCAAIRPGRSRGGGRPRSCARRASSRSGPSPRSAARPPPSCCRSRSSATAGGSTSTGPPSPPSAAGDSAWSTRCPSATSPASWPPRYAREDAVDEAARFLAERPYLPSERAGDVVAVHRRLEVLTCGSCSSAPTCGTGGAERHWATLIPELARPRHSREAADARRTRARSSTTWPRAASPAECLDLQRPHEPARPAAGAVGRCRHSSRTPWSRAA